MCLQLLLQNSLPPSERPVANARKRTLDYEHKEVKAFTEDTIRSGKWTHEEEVYAELLIEKYESGTLQDCPNGTTLRAYLSIKLKCIPMRVSKKYGGRCVGRQTYTHGSTVESPLDAERTEALASASWTSFKRHAGVKRHQKKVRCNAPQLILESCLNRDFIQFSSDSEDMIHCDIQFVNLFGATEIGEYGSRSWVDASCSTDPTVVDWSQSDDYLLLL